MYAIQHIWCLFQARINGKGYGRKGIQCKNGGDDGGGGTESTDRVVSSQTVGASALLSSPCTIKPRDGMYHPMGAPHKWVNVSSGNG